LIEDLPKTHSQICNVCHPDNLKKNGKMPINTTTQKSIAGVKTELMVYLLLTICYVISGKLG